MEHTNLYRLLDGNPRSDKSKDIFCEKLEAYGFDKLSVNWFRSYLTGRSQRVMLGSTISNSINLDLGSPQGAILSPSIFIILLADMELFCPESKLCGYADDTSLTISSKELNSLKQLYVNLK